MRSRILALPHYLARPRPRLRPLLLRLQRRTALQSQLRPVLLTARSLRMLRAWSSLINPSLLKRKWPVCLASLFVPRRERKSFVVLSKQPSLVPCVDLMTSQTLCRVELPDLTLASSTCTIRPSELWSDMHRDGHSRYSNQRRNERIRTTARSVF